MTATNLSSTSFTLSSTSFKRLSTPATRSSTTSTLSPISLTSLLMAFVIFRSCAEAIRASSCVSLSSLFSVSSMSFFPISFFRYFSEYDVVRGILFVKKTLTCSALLDFFCCNSNKVEDLDRNFRDCVHHSLIWCHFSVYVQTSEKCFYALERLKKCVLVRANVFSCLKIVRITMDRGKVL
jgi:hypothetical protein